MRLIFSIFVLLCSSISFCYGDQRANREVSPVRTWALSLGRETALTFVWNPRLQLWVSRYEITNEQYRRYDASHEGTNYYYCGRVTDEARQPVVFVSWEDAHNFCAWVTRRFGERLPEDYVCRLPTEQEWTALATGGFQRPYPWGHQWPPPNEWNYRGEEGSGIIFQLFQKESFLAGHHDAYVVAGPVDCSGVNDISLYGIGGNVWEWCRDWYDTNRWTRVVRGGSWYNYEKRHLALSHRADVNPEWKNAMIGFRVVVASRHAPAP